MLRTVLDTIPQRVFWKDRNSIFLGGNKAYAQDCGFSNPDDLVGKSDDETISSTLAELYRADDRQVLETGVAKLNFEEPTVRSDGTQGWLKSSKVPLFDENNHVIGVLGTYEDITERKKSEAALAEASNLLETMLENSPDCIYYKDRESRFVRFSKAFEKLFKVADAESLRGKTDFDFFAPTMRGRLSRTSRTSSGRALPLIGKLEKETHPDGHVTWALTTKMPWREQGWEHHRHLRHFQGCDHDQGDRRQARPGARALSGAGGQSSGFHLFQGY